MILCERNYKSIVKQLSMILELRKKYRIFEIIQTFVKFYLVTFLSWEYLTLNNHAQVQKNNYHLFFFYFYYDFMISQMIIIDLEESVFSACDLS